MKWLDDMRKQVAAEQYDSLGRQIRDLKKKRADAYEVLREPCPLCHNSHYPLCWED